MIWYLLLLLGIVSVCVIVNLNSGEDEENVSDRDLREAFLKEYINSDSCVLVKLNSLPKSFKIGDVYFDKYVEDTWSYQTFLSHVVIDRKVYDNGNVSIYQEWDSSCRITNKDLMGYILNNLDKVEEVKQ